MSEPTTAARLDVPERALDEGALPMPPSVTLPPPPPAALGPGQLWVVLPGEDEPLRGASGMVLITEAKTTPPRGVLACDQTWIAGADELVLGADDSSAEVALAVCLAREMPLDPASLGVYLGQVDEATTEVVVLCLEQRRGAGHWSEPLGLVASTYVTGADEASLPLLRWRLRTDDGRSCEYLAGPALGDAGDDPRVRAQAALFRATDHIRVRGEALVEPVAEAARVWTRIAELWEGLRGALLRAQASFDEALAPLGAPAFAGAVRAEAAEPERASFAATLSLGPVDVELLVDRGGGLGISAVAYFRADDAPAVGVTAVLEVARAEAEPLMIKRVTEAPEGDFGRLSLPIEEGARYRLRLAYADAEQTLDW